MSGSLCGGKSYPTSNLPRHSHLRAHIAPRPEQRKLRVVHMAAMTCVSFAAVARPSAAFPRARRAPGAASSFRARGLVVRSSAPEADAYHSAAAPASAVPTTAAAAPFGRRAAFASAAMLAASSALAASAADADFVRDTKVGPRNIARHVIGWHLLKTE